MNFLTKLPKHLLQTLPTYSLTQRPRFHLIHSHVVSYSLSLYPPISQAPDNSPVHVFPARRKQKGGGARDKGLRKNARNSYSESKESKFDVGDLFPVLERLELVMGLIHLDRFPDSLKSLVQTVTEILVMAVELCGNGG
jgi:hypothetical protein